MQPAHPREDAVPELGHAFLHSEPMNRALAELEAESVAFIVCDGLGIQSDAWSFGYVASWSGGGDVAIVAIKAAATLSSELLNNCILSALQLEVDSIEVAVSNDGPESRRNGRVRRGV